MNNRFLKRLAAAVLLVSLLLACSACGGKKHTLSDLESALGLRSAFTDPVSFYKNAQALGTDYLIDPDQLTDGWTAPEILQNDLLPMYTKNYDDSVAHATIFGEHSFRKAGALNSAALSNVTDAGEAPAGESLQMFASMYAALRTELGEADVLNVDVMYNDEVNVDPAEVDAYLSAGDVSHSYYAQWRVEGGYNISIEFNGPNSVVPTGVSITMSNP